jgi:thymidylate synthase
LDLIRNILENGYWEEGRNGRTKSVFGNMMRFSLADGVIPLLTTKKMAWKTCLKELLWFIRGDTDAAILQKQGVRIWDSNSSREFLDSQGLQLYPEGVLGPIYGYQWRNFNANYNCFTASRLLNSDSKDVDVHKNRKEFQGIDQLQQIIDALKDPAKRTSRRLIMTAWNPAQLDQMALPPCHVMCQFNVHDGNKLSCAMTQRSVDVICGCPFNIASYAFLTHLLAKHCGLIAHEFVYFMGNCHIYEDHVEAAMTQMSREPRLFPKLTIHGFVKEKIDDYLVEDFEILDYTCHPEIKVRMVA